MHSFSFPDINGPCMDAKGVPIAQQGATILPKFPQTFPGNRLLGGKSLTVSLDYTKSSDVVKLRDLLVSARQPGATNFFTETNLPVTVKPGELVNLELDVEIFDISKDISEQSLSKRGCVTKTDEEWKLILFSTYT